MDQNAALQIALADDLFESAPSITTLVVNNENGVILGNQSFTVTGTIQLTKGVLTSNSTGRVIFDGNATIPSESTDSNIEGYVSIQNLAIASGVYRLTIYGMKGRYDCLIVIR